MKKSFRLQGLDCADCAAKIERGIGKLDGVDNVTVNFMTTKMIIEADEDKFSKIMEDAEKVVHKYEPDTVIKKG